MKRGPAVVGAALAAMSFGGILVAQTALRRWGATVEEEARELPGDDLVRPPSGGSTLAVDVAAPAEEVWRWLVQLGQDRGGWYSYEWLENLLGLRIHSADEVHEEWQHLAVGDRVLMVRPGWLGLLPDGFGPPVALIEPPRTLVLRFDPASTPWDAVWSFHVVANGPDRSRLLARSREHRPLGTGPALLRAVGVPMELGTLFMTRKMLLGIKKRAEGVP